jgi:hypothetical protein
VQQRCAGIVGRLRGEKAPRHRYVSEIAILLREQTEGRDGVQQHLGGAAIGPKPRRNAFSPAPIFHHGEQVEFQCRQNRAAFLKGPNAGIQIIR